MNMKRGLNVRVSAKGQISIFIILGIVIAGGMIYSFKIKNDAKLNNEFFSQEDIKTQLENIQANILTCIDEAGREGLNLIGMQGGYYKRPLKYIDLDGVFIPYYYYEGEFLMPSLEDVSSELGDYVEEKAGACLKELEFDGFELKPTKVDVKVIISDGEVIFKADSFVVIKKDGRSITFETKNHPVSRASALKDILDIARYITDSHKIDAKMYCISCVEEIAREKDVYVEHTPIFDNSVFITIGENRTSDKPYVFNFLNKYTREEASDDFALTGENADSLPGSSGGFE